MVSHRPRKATAVIGACTAITAALSGVFQAPGASADAPSYDSGSQPVYAVAHRVLTSEGVVNALAHGANALEVDATAWTDGGWYADHDGTITSRGDTLEEVFDQVTTERARGARINFVWLDIKNPDFCGGSSPQRTHCSVAGLRDLARRKLENRGVRVLYGFSTSSVGGVGWKAVNDGLKAKEGVAISGNYDDVRTAFARLGTNIPRSQRVMDNGLFDPNLNFASIGRQLRLGAQARERGELAGVFGWTISGSVGHTGAAQVDAYLGSRGSGADGLIYGHSTRCYPDGVPAPEGCGKDDSAAERSLRYITDWVQAHSTTQHLATNGDIPFGY
ncbi:MULTISPECIES: phospholipase [unclassified Streptomyces]|uniref:phospholipase n=1 Tax=unclassified Streptomyces TaxID=2593676 RepID=UPI002365CF3F|nr:MULTISPECIES: phospholipase [unclassified Streptomyces]MDF3146732.1 phospholipase [Streptomyces sp. T21Q-yed]WDF37865.1 phospholipase [Streptomyces sp. T12]